jgi:rare lipoprotein A (peptidoglycan hydrolase)
MKKYLKIGFIVLAIVILFSRQLYRMGYQVGFGAGTAMVREKDAIISRMEFKLADANDRYDRAMQMMTFVGFSTWYGDEEQGKPTSLGKPFDKNDLTVASKFLPYHSYWIVTNLENGKQVGVWITDDGPNIIGGNRIGRFLDLSEAAARRIDMKTRGVVLTSISPMIAKPRSGD